jgi:hypothetical protein
MICSKCLSSNFVHVIKKTSQLDKKNDKLTSFMFCKTCEPIFASLELLEDGFQVACQLLNQNPKEEKTNE